MCISKMKFVGVVLTSVLSAVVGQSLADSCKTCRGSDCMVDNVFQLDCTKFVPALPFESQLISYEVGEHSEYGCLELEYYIGDSVEQIQQCVLSNDLGSFCDMLGNMLKIESCSVERTGVVKRVKRVPYTNVDEVLDDLGSGETPIPPLPGSGVLHLVSFTCLLAIIATVCL